MPAIEAIDAAEVDAELEEYEGEIRSFAQGARAAATALLKNGAPNPAAKWADVYLKSMRLVDEMRSRRREIEHEQELLAHERQMRGRN